MPPESWTILGLLKWATDYFKSHHIEQPRAAAEILLSHALHISRIDLYLQYDRPLEAGELNDFKALVKRRLAREPAAYIVGEKGFWTLDFAVSTDVLIPRPETELLVETALSIIPLATANGGLKIIDLGTGSGAIVVTLARERPGHRYYGVDVSARALEEARKNAVRHGVDQSIVFVHGSWFGALRKGDGPFDVIIANPPYVRREVLDTLPAEISRYEPREALDGGPDGLDHLRKIISEGPENANPGGWMLLEIGHDQGAAVEALMVARGSYDDILVLKDYAGLDRVVRARCNRPTCF